MNNAFLRLQYRLRHPAEAAAFNALVARLRRTGLSWYQRVAALLF